MSKLMLLGVLAGGLVGRTLLGQDQVPPTVAMTSARETRTVTLRVTVFSPDKSLLVPFCGEGEGGTETLCSLSVRVEVQSRAGWRTMRPRQRNVVLGGVPPDKWKVRVISAGGRHDFFFAFTKDDFLVGRGQRLRIVIDTWLDEQSMRSHGQPIQVTSPAFDCP